jgi:hypothetical protein
MAILSQNTNKEFWALGIHPFYSPLPKAQNRKSYFAIIRKKEDQKETNNEDEKKLLRLTSCIRLQKFASIIFQSSANFFHPNFCLLFLFILH